jgi:uncharacterized membrane-anchored protein
MKMTKARSLFLALLVLLQVGVLVWIATTNQRVIAMGTPVLVKTVPVDPQDPFRGDYVRLRYDFNRVDLSKVQHPDVETYVRGDVVYLNLIKDGKDGKYWKADALFKVIPEMWNDPLLKGRVTYADEKAVEVEYGIEQFYVPQGAARHLDGTQQQQLDVQLRVRADGVARVEQVWENGKALGE